MNCRLQSMNKYKIKLHKSTKSGLDYTMAMMSWVEGVIAWSVRKRQKDEMSKLGYSITNKWSCEWVNIIRMCNIYSTCYVLMFMMIYGNFTALRSQFWIIISNMHVYICMCHELYTHKIVSLVFDIFTSVCVLFQIHILNSSTTTTTVATAAVAALVFLYCYVVCRYIFYIYGFHTFHSNNFSQNTIIYFAPLLWPERVTYTSILYIRIAPHFTLPALLILITQWKCIMA